MCPTEKLVITSTSSYSCGNTSENLPKSVLSERSGSLQVNILGGMGHGRTQPTLVSAEGSSPLSPTHV